MLITCPTISYTKRWQLLLTQNLKFNFMKKKNDTELMNDFNLKYSHYSCEEFMSTIHSCPNDNSLENLFRKIFTPNNFKGIGFKRAVSLKSKLKQLKTNEPNTKLEILSRIELLQDEIDRS